MSYKMLDEHQDNAAWTDYPFVSLGDVPGEPAKLRQVQILGYDNDKYALVKIEEDGKFYDESLKAGYLYKTKGRFGEVEQVDFSELRFVCCKSEGEIFRGYGPAIDRSYIHDGFMFITNDEYESLVHFCPLCKYPGRPLKEYQEKKGDNYS